MPTFTKHSFALAPKRYYVPEIPTCAHAHFNYNFNDLTYFFVLLSVNRICVFVSRKRGAKVNRKRKKNIKGAWVLISKPTVFCTILLPCMNFQLILPCQQQLDYVFSSSAIALRIRLSWNWWKKVHTNRIRAQAQELLEVYTSDFWLQLMFS